MQSPPKNIVIAPDSFKESLSALEVAQAIRKGLTQVWETLDSIVECPIADGGEGSIDAILNSVDGERIAVDVQDPVGRTVTASYALMDNGATAFIEIAEASGLMRLQPNERNPERASTFGTGQLLAHALDRGVTRCIVGIGGSATNDAGTGLATALGYRFLDKQGNPVVPGGEQLGSIHTIDDSNKHPALDSTEILIACDVNNPLFGPEGATITYGAQKGATPEQQQSLEGNMQHFAPILDAFAKNSVSTMPGSGAAGGLGAGLVAFCGGTLQPGFSLIADLINLEQRIANADLVITGEGRVDFQTLHGKVLSGIAKLTTKHDKPLVAFCGAVANPEALGELNIASIHSIMEIAKHEDDAMRNAAKYLEQLAATFARDWKRMIDSGS